MFTRFTINAAGISIHSLPKEGDPLVTLPVILPALFQSTPSPRRETIIACKSQNVFGISIHSLPKEGD